MTVFFPTAECYGVFAQYRFRCVLGALGSSRKEPGSGNRFRELVPGTSSGNQFWELDPGFDGFRQVLRFQGSGSEGCVKEVSKVSVFDGFRGVRFCSRGFDGTWNPRYSEGSGPRFPTVTVYFEGILLYFKSVLLYFESMLLYVESILVVLCKSIVLR